MERTINNMEKTSNDVDQVGKYVKEENVEDETIEKKHEHRRASYTVSRMASPKAELILEDRSAPPTSKHEVPIETLVFSGGSIKGISHIGAVEALYDLGLQKNVKRYVGSSVGAIIAGLLAIGYAPVELKTAIFKLDLGKLQNIQPKNVFTQLGMDDGKRIHDEIRRLISVKASPEVTLGDIYKSRGVSVHITASCLNTGRLAVFSHENEPDLPLHLAIRMSISIPIMFAPVLYRGKQYIDGGCIDNFAINLFPQPSTLGFMLAVTRDEKMVRNLEDLLQQLLITTLQNTSRDAFTYPDITINIESPLINILDFNISLKVKQEFIKIGYDSVIKHFAIQL
jgi:NTE family protein